jgi:hypothetical protein
MDIDGLPGSRRREQADRRQNLGPPLTVRILRAAILAAAVIAAGCGSPIKCDSHPMMDVTVPIAALPDPADAGAADGGIQDLVDACQMLRGSGACVTLCQLAVGPENSRYIHTCELTTADGGVAVHAIASGSCAV